MRRGDDVGNTLSGIPGTGFTYETRRKRQNIQKAFKAPGVDNEEQALSEFLLSTALWLLPGQGGSYPGEEVHPHPT